MNLIFSPTTAIQFAGNTFIEVPVILEVDDTPLIEVITAETVHRTTQFSIYNDDGIYIAKIVGPRIFLTKDGARSGLALRFPDKMTVCSLGNRTLFEMRRTEAAAIAITAELFTSTGRFVRSNLEKATLLSEAVEMLSTSMFGCTITNCRVGVHFSTKAVNG